MNGAELIAKERERQIAEEGWTAEHDDQHKNGELARAAIAYIANGLLDVVMTSALWPRQWERAWFKPKDRIRNLVRAGALIAAEIDRLQREQEGKDGMG